MVMNDDVVSQQVCICYVGHEQIAITYQNESTRPELLLRCIAFVSLAMHPDRSSS